MIQMDELYDRVKRWRDDFQEKQREGYLPGSNYYGDAASGLCIALQEIDRERYDKESKG